MMSEKQQVTTPNPAPGCLFGPQCKNMRLSVREEILACGLLVIAV